MQSRLLSLSGKPAGWLRAFLRHEGGTTIVEYGIAAALIGVVAIISLSHLGNEVDATFDCLEDQLATANGRTVMMPCEDMQPTPPGGGGGGP